MDPEKQMWGKVGECPFRMWDWAQSRVEEARRGIAGEESLPWLVCTVSLSVWEASVNVLQPLLR